MENETQETADSEGAGNPVRKKMYAAASIGIVALLVLVAFGFAFSTGPAGLVLTGVSASPDGASTGASGSSVKEFTLSFSGGSYQPNPITVNKGDTVRLVADMGSILGCYRTVVIPKFGVRKTVSVGDNIIEFTASEAGTFQVTCGMGMAGGSIVVKDESGSVPKTTDITGAPKQGSCGSSGGGCGCGAR